MRNDSLVDVVKVDTIFIVSVGVYSIHGGGGVHIHYTGVRVGKTNLFSEGT